MLDIYAYHKAEVWITVIILAVLFCMFHYLIFGPCRIENGSKMKNDYVQRFKLRERISHGVTMLLFLIVAFTGILQVLGRVSSHTGPHHGFLGFTLVIVFIINFVNWSRDSLFKGYDIIWLKSMGGYLSKNHVQLPAGRFNAGQKIYFWLIWLSLIALLVTAILMEIGHDPHTLVIRQTLIWSIHGLIGCFATTIVIGHAYLSTLANPQTMRVLWFGNIPRSYAEEYHSKWTIRN